MSGYGLLCFDKLFRVINGSHDVIVTCLFHHLMRIGPSQLQVLPFATVPSRRIYHIVLRSGLKLIILVADERTLVYVSSASTTIDGWSCLSINRIFVGSIISCASQRIRQFRSCFFIRELKRSHLRFMELFFYFLFKIHQLFLYFRVDVSLFI